ncbi:recombinase family protein [Corallococcus macrosporus]|nr:recombinase family protein [Corallococcus macrosporus]
MDLSTPTGRLLVHLIASLAEFERELIRDRVRAGLPG